MNKAVIFTWVFCACGGGSDSGSSRGPSGAGQRAGDGSCTGSESASNTPQDCPAVSGDGFCTHSENAVTTPQDCPAVAGDGFCTHSENAATAPQDCAAVSGDGRCTHTENAQNTPQDCPAAAGDGFCTHNENAGTTPQDCAAVSGDGRCTHTENAQNTPQDCPAVAGDGFCTHNETYSAAPTDCPPPDVVFPGGSLAALRAYSPDLHFGDLTLAGNLSLSPNDGTVTLIVDTFTTAGGGVGVTRSACDWSASPNLVIDAVGPVVINDFIGLYGRVGVGITSSATCNSCDGSAGGDVWISGTTVTVNDSIDSDGGWGGWMNLSNNITVGCNGGAGGDVHLTASTRIDIGPFEVVGRGGDAGTGNTGNGSPGADGDLQWLAPTVMVNEKESNYTFGIARWLAVDPLTVTGASSATDDQATQGSPSALYVDAGNGPDYVEDLYIFRVTSPGSVTVTLTAANTSTDLDVYLFYQSFFTTAVAESKSPGGTESFTKLLNPGVYFLAVSWCCNTPTSAYTLRLTR